MSKFVGKILIVDDDPSNIEILSEILEDQYEVLFATNGEMAVDLARKELPDLVVLDVMMPGMSGYAVCKELKKENATALIPVIFLTSLEDVEDETHGLEIGAIDYITKPIRPAIVRIRVRNHMELKKTRDKLEELSTTDALTGLANRRQFDIQIASEHLRSRRSGTPLSLVMIDVDHFKVFNDTYGHQAGDKCLMKIGSTIRQVVNRPQDIPARYGGEEFACVLPDTDHQGALKIATVIKEQIADARISNIGSSVADHVTASLGVATVSASKPISIETLIKMADEQLYLAKEFGRNCVKGVQEN